MTVVLGLGVLVTAVAGVAAGAVAVSPGEVLHAVVAGGPEVD